MTEVAVIGAGVVGLACGAAAARRGLSVTVLERHARPLQEASSRNSGVIHAGIYYPTGSLKAAACVAGRQRLYARCAKYDIPHRKIGKLIVATDSAQIAALEALYLRGLENGAGELEMLDAEEVRRREPRVNAVAALWSPRTGIVDAHELAASYRVELERYGGVLALRTNVRHLEPRRTGWRVDTVGADGEPFAIDVGIVVNAAGLGAERLAASAGIDTAAKRWRLYACKGDYFSVAPSLGRLTEHLVYPVPGVAGLGIHVTLDLSGGVRLGPDSEYIDEPRLDVDPDKAERFAAAVRPFLPEVQSDRLSPDYAGIRAKLQAPGESFRDFVLEEGSDDGAAGLVNLLGIESPGLTAAADLAERVADRVEAIQ
jgi:L-2-hydroxyglutarate oxidase LhgO